MQKYSERKFIADDEVIKLFQSFFSLLFDARWPTTTSTQSSLFPFRHLIFGRIGMQDQTKIN